MHLLETGLDVVNLDKGEYDAPPSSPEINENEFQQDLSDSDDDVFFNPVLVIRGIDIPEDSLSSEEGPYDHELWRYHADQFQRILVDRPEIFYESSDMDSFSEHSLELDSEHGDEQHNNSGYIQQPVTITNARYVNILSPRDADRESMSSSSSSLSSVSSQSSNNDAPGDSRYSAGHDGPSFEDYQSHNSEYPGPQPGN